MLLYVEFSPVSMLLSLLLQGRRLIALDMGALIAGAKYRGMYTVHTINYITLNTLCNGCIAVLMSLVYCAHTTCTSLEATLLLTISSCGFKYAMYTRCCEALLSMQFRYVLAQRLHVVAYSLALSQLVLLTP
jgi:hypothetical protein